MKTIEELSHLLCMDAFSRRLARLYGCALQDAQPQAARCAEVLKGLEDAFGPHAKAAIFSAPGRTELGGNHTDHQRGCVLAGSVTLDILAAAAPNQLNQIRLKSEGYPLLSIGLTELEKRADEAQTSCAILRGICAGFAQRGAKLIGLDIYMTSQVPKGSGLSSSAAFEVLLATVLNALQPEAARLTPVEIAQLSQFAENVYFEKPCGLMDQMASSVGGVIGIDFGNPEQPLVTPAALPLAEAGLALCILDCGVDHASLTDEYAAVPAECQAVAEVCGGRVLGEVPEALFWEKLDECRRRCSDRAVLRAIHFYGENRRVKLQIAALNQKNYAAFLRLVNESGNSSWEYLQNIIPTGAIQRQEAALAIAVARAALGGRGAVRIHGGGFAGTIQAFVPVEMLDQFRKKTEAVLGAGSCHQMEIRSAGGVRLA